MFTEIPADKIDTNALAQVIDEGIVDISTGWCAVKTCIHEFTTGDGERAQIHLTVTREQNEMEDDVSECVIK